ncbi:MAG: NAD(+) synthase [Candidatus Sericytochromatia bacterium]|nr:NAD(+) synthase [Candidatus Sericytochromatia bacterium]
MTVLRVGAACLNQTPLDWSGNQRRIREAIAEARAQGVSLLCLPELCITGYGCEDAFHAPGVQETALAVLRDLLPDTQGMVVSFGLPLVHRNAIFNAACLVADGRILGFVAKKHLAGDGLHYEPRWFKPWPTGVRSTLTVDGAAYPLGDLAFDLGGVKLGFEICEDAWVAKRPGAELAQHGVDLILNPSASHFAFGKAEIRRRFVLEGSRAFSVGYLYANLVGCEAGRVIYDGGALIASAGQLLAQGPRFSFRDVQVTTAWLDLEAPRLTQRRSASFRPALGAEAEAYFVADDFCFPACAALPLPEAPPVAAWEQSPRLKDEELARAVSLGLFDYMRKSRSRGFVLSLSGGADSAACAVLVHLMALFGLAELGQAGLVAKLPHLPQLAALPAEAEAFTSALLTCVYQATRHSGAVTREAAQAVAHAVGARFHHFDVEALVEGYQALVASALGRPLDWATDDAALQNIQARVRAPGVWMLANLAGALLLSTSNRSEAAVGYATMDGDTAGGLCPIGGLDKASLRTWLARLETDGLEGVPPFPALGLVNRQAPTAELRPAERHQTDEADLMPYEVLDAIERAAIRDKKMPLAAYQVVCAQFQAHAPLARWSAAQLGAWVTRFFRLWSQNQWKRERYAPSFHLDDENLDPKTWCRFPILSGGFERELSELQAALESTIERPQAPA